ncbi:uncharacterized protein DSM5745_04173 [Aspergillus mulundensis]|uniref:F-box domain-containing protein n=1 Tax=Aspergillus mulundensis TaxID=1810919 RepID=A0A3D8SBX2_9EURO|nr:hypothetical protein DSM5745_04173 [Aspergillus mulundensis]RDW83847.1 hypothetical protein DSM5745_04173 [Aspergillus mulundensis]
MSVSAPYNNGSPGPVPASVQGPATRRNTHPPAGLPKGKEKKERSLYEDDIYVSPILERRPSWSGTRWTRFFPELSSHFSLVSPTSPPRRQPQSYGSPQSGVYFRENSSEEDTSETATGTPSLWSDELVDDASSCYSRRSSITSLGSELSASAYKSADAFSIMSPTRAGVFDEISVYRSASNMSRRSPRSPSLREKPLPIVPPIQMAPLSIRRKKKQPPVIREDRLNEILESTAATHGHNPTLSQAAEELENALAGLVKRRNSLPRIDTPLQVSRGNMDMIPSRSAPSPPIDLLKNRKLSLSIASPDEEMRRAKKPHKGRLSFTMPGFGKKKDRPHLRSLSGSNVITGLERKHARHSAAASQSSAKESEKENEAVRSAKTDFLNLPPPPARSVSVSSERHLRLKLPRLQTKEVQSPGSIRCERAPLKTPAADDEEGSGAQEPAASQPKPRKTFSFEPEGTMSKQTVASEPLGPAYETDTHSAPVVIYELDAGLPEQQIKSPVVAPPFVPSGQMPGTLPDEVVAMILRHCSSLPDLFNFAVMNRQFYRVFKKHELDLIKSTVFQMSPPAWELREMSPPWDSEWQVLFDLDAPVPEYTPSLYLDRYTRDLYTLVTLKGLILARCTTFLRPETVSGLSGVDDTRAEEIDNAFWRVWTFCRIFGCGKGREGDVVGQLDWLNGGIMATSQPTSVTMSISEPFGINNVLFEPPEGFGRGNPGGLSHSQLYDMTEIWTCLGVLLQPIHGKCEAARKAGIFNGHVADKDSVKEEETLEEWTSYILTLGPSAVLALGSIATVDNADEIFQRAQTLGLTKWEPADASRSIFFREAVSKAYKPREPLPRKSSPLRQTNSNASRSSGSSDTSPSNSISGKTHRRRQAAYAEQLRNRRAQNPDLSYIEERPISSYAEIMNRLAGAPPHPFYHQQSQEPVPPLPTPASTSTTAPPSSPPAAVQPPQVPPINTHNLQIPYTNARPPRPPVQIPQVRDPADQAIEMMVRELGFVEEDAKWALKITDTGEGINPNAAVSLLVQEYQRQSLNLGQNAYGYSTGPVLPPGTRPMSGHSTGARNSILYSVMHSQEAMGSGWRWA